MTLRFWKCPNCHNRPADYCERCPICGAPRGDEPITVMEWPPASSHRHHSATTGPMLPSGVLDRAFVNNILGESVNPF